MFKFIQTVYVMWLELDPRSAQLHRLFFTLSCINFSVSVLLSEARPLMSTQLLEVTACMLNFDLYNTCAIGFLIDITVLRVFNEAFGVRHLWFENYFFHSVVT